MSLARRTPFLASATATALLRVLVCLLLALFWGYFAYFTTRTQGVHRDFGQMWFAARTLLHGGDPYAAIGPGRAFEWSWPWYYPLPAALVALPVAPLSEPAAVGVMVFVSVALFAWALTARGTAPLLAFGSFCMWHALYLAQWSPLLAAAVVITPLSAILVAKPTIGAAIFAARPSWWAVAGAIVLLSVAFVVQPHWVQEWRSALARGVVEGGKVTSHAPPILYPGGVIVLVALSRWRRRDARLLVALACVPQTTFPYEGVPLFLIPEGWIESGVLMASSWVMRAWVVHLHGPSPAQTVTHYGQAFLVFLYLPALVMVLRRPNEGPAPAWLERAIGWWQTRSG
ncbi:MAG TPA: hypothetical protein VGP25_05780 [Gemmatimonadaceae bacterium]|nr:hypothetical protein [Gemmatimonadaceae bacterium]